MPTLAFRGPFNHRLAPNKAIPTTTPPTIKTESITVIATATGERFLFIGCGVVVRGTSPAVGCRFGAVTTAIAGENGVEGMGLVEKSATGSDISRNVSAEAL